ncbi:dynein axonemal heavy chain 3-like [Planococcus citri]|uniref:dynein axonemal heavy chain 3-like n=1 Tax=Planococcus citri TaxID=170843 RepID=UPI0031F8391F
MRWFELETELDKALVRSVGDIFLSSAFITYLSYFSSEFRKQIIKEWCNQCKEMQLPLSPEYTFSTNFIDSDDIRFWNMAKLSTDAASVDNYTIISKTIYLPVIIDPQGQGRNYIQYVESKNDLQIVKITDQDYVDNLKKAITNGQPVLLQDIPEKLDDVIVSLIHFNTFKEEDVTYLRLNKENVPLNSDFKVYVTCSKPKPIFTPDINNTVTIINFEMTSEGLENCLLRVVISVDAPDLEEQNNNLLLQCAEDSRTLYQTEDKILNVLSSSIGNILEDETALQTLNDSKNLLEQIREKQKHSLAAEENLKEAYKLYKIICKQVTSMYFGIQNLQQMNALYCFSVHWFICLFQQAVKKSPKSQVMEQRINFVNKRFTCDLYREIDMCLEKKDMLPAVFVLALQMKPVQESIKKTMIENLSPSLCVSQLPIIGKRANERITWSIPSTFNNIDDKILILEHLECDYDLAYSEIKTLLNHLTSCSVLDHNLLDSLGTEHFISNIKKLIRNVFIHDEEPSQLNLYEIYHNTSVKLPIICGLTDIDVDPLIDIQHLATEMGLEEDIMNCVPFIETQIPSLLNSVNEALTKGTWIVIQNCHLLRKSSNYLEFLNNHISNSKSINPQFRLWIVTFPFNEFPPDVSSKGIKIMMKEAFDLGSNIHHLYTYTSLMSPHLLESKKTVKNWQFILFFVYFCHSMLKLLWKTGLFRGNQYCSITKSNLHTMTSLVEILFTSNEQEFIAGFRYLSNECNYCAHLPDTEERLILSKVIESLKIENFSRPTSVSVCSKSFPAPEDVSFNGCLRYAQSMKKTNLREYFQLYYCSGLKRGWTFVNLWKMVRKLYFNLDNSSIIDESTVLNLINDILTVLEQFYTGFDKAKLSSGKDILNIFLKQEIKLYLRLLDYIFQSLNRLKDVIFGKLPITEEYRKMFVILQNNQLPQTWAQASYPTSLSLLQYIVNLNRRLIFINKWIHYGIPDVVWLPGLFNVRAFFTSILYNYSSYRDICIEDTELYCQVTKFYDTTLSEDEWRNYQQEQKKGSKFGIFVQGLLLLGSIWNANEMKLDYIDEEKYFQVLPIIWIEPKSKPKKESENLYKCPMYWTNATGDYLLENYIISMSLPCLEDPIVLTQRGVKLLVL